MMENEPIMSNDLGNMERTCGPLSAKNVVRLDEMNDSGETDGKCKSNSKKIVNSWAMRRSRGSQGRERKISETRFMTDEAEIKSERRNGTRKKGRKTTIGRLGAMGEGRGVGLIIPRPCRTLWLRGRK